MEVAKAIRGRQHAPSATTSTADQSEWPEEEVQEVNQREEVEEAVHTPEEHPAEELETEQALQTRAEGSEAANSLIVPGTAPTEVAVPPAGANQVVDYTNPAAKYTDITHLLNMPQAKAAEVLGMPMSTLSKRWKEAVRSRKWPFRQVSKLDKEIMTLLHNIPPGTEGDPQGATPPEIAQALGVLLKRRQDELKPVHIRR